MGQQRISTLQDGSRWTRVRSGTRTWLVTLEEDGTVFASCFERATCNLPSWEGTLTPAIIVTMPKSVQTAAAGLVASR